jgi:hypothetical protein
VHGAWSPSEDGIVQRRAKPYSTYLSPNVQALFDHCTNHSDKQDATRVYSKASKQGMRKSFLESIDTVWQPLGTVQDRGEKYVFPSWLQENRRKTSLSAIQNRIMPSNEDHVVHNRKESLLPNIAGVKISASQWPSKNLLKTWETFRKDTAIKVLKIK